MEELFEAGKRQGRTVLTLSARRPKRYSDVPALVVPRADPAAAIRALAESHEPAGPPFSRCPDCNEALQRRTSFEAAGEVPSKVLRGSTSLHYCPHCGKWYWEGSHVARLKQWLEQALGRPLGGPG